jgi:hypothetical protein
VSYCMPGRGGAAPGNPVRDYIHQSSGYRTGCGCCRIRVYEAARGDAPVVLCSELPPTSGEELSRLAGMLAAEVIRACFPDGLPDLPRPLLWIEHRPPRRRGPGRYALLTFPCYVPTPEGAGFVRRFTLGLPSREPLSLAEVEILVGEEIQHL